jgi:hypothetical protein
MHPGHLRLFAACNNMKTSVLNADNGELVAPLQIRLLRLLAVKVSHFEHPRHRELSTIPI